MKNRYLIKFNKYPIEILFLTVMGSLFTYYLICNLSNLFFINIIFIIFGIYKCILSFSLYKRRLITFLILQRQFKTKIRKSIIYNLLDEPCTSCIAKELIKEFNIK